MPTPLFDKVSCDPSIPAMVFASSLLLLLAVTHALQTPHHAPSVASRAGVVHANLNTLRAPPAPPPTIGDGGDGGVVVVVSLTNTCA